MLTNGVGYRTDDHGDTAAAATPLPAGGNPSTGYSNYASLGAYTLDASVPQIVTYTITPTSGPHGSVTPATPQVVSAGSNLTFTMAPDAGYHVQDVLVDGLSVGAVGSFEFASVVADHTIAASFAQDLPPKPTVTNPNTGGSFGTPRV